MFILQNSYDFLLDIIITKKMQFVDKRLTINALLLWRKKQYQSSNLAKAQQAVVATCWASLFSSYLRHNKGHDIDLVTIFLAIICKFIRDIVLLYNRKKEVVKKILILAIDFENIYEVWSK